MTDATVPAMADSDTTGFDPEVIVVGSGSAGAAAARRLVDREGACSCSRLAARTSTPPSTTPGACTSCG